MPEEYPGLIEADCHACAVEKMRAALGDNPTRLERMGLTSKAFMDHPSQYTRCGNKRCACLAHHDIPCSTPTKGTP